MNLRGIKIHRTFHEYTIKCDPIITQKIKKEVKNKGGKILGFHA
jgi:hypothetical protein